MWNARGTRHRKSRPPRAEEEERLADGLRVQTLADGWAQAGDAGVYMIHTKVYKCLGYPCVRSTFKNVMIYINDSFLLLKF